MHTSWAGQKVAVKVAEGGSRARDPWALYQRKALAKEAASLAALQGIPGIVPILGTVTVEAVGGGQAFAGFVMPIAEGGDVFDVMDSYLER
ncbi:hypothetical protein WJX73_001538 [Symbiochloris irregularis]